MDNFDLLRLKYFAMPHLRDEVERYLPFVNDPQRPSGVFRNGKGIRLVKKAARFNK